MLALIALTFMAFFYYGMVVVEQTLISVLACLIVDIVAKLLRGKKLTEDVDLTGITTGFVISLMMPAGVPITTLIITCVIGQVIGKQIFGGYRNLIFAPAAVGYTFSAICWEHHIFTYPKPMVEMSINYQVFDGYSNSFSSMLNDIGKSSVAPSDILLGNIAGPMGATHILVLAVCAIILLLRNKVSVMSFIGTIGFICLGCFFFPRFEVSGLEAIFYELSSNMLLFGLLFIASDKGIAPKNNVAGLIYGIILGIVVVIINSYFGRENAIIYASLVVSPLSIAIDKNIIVCKVFLSRQFEKLSINLRKCSSKIVTQIKARTSQNENKNTDIEIDREQENGK